LVAVLTRLLLRADVSVGRGVKKSADAPVHDTETEVDPAGVSIETAR
jgi:hypothetical protein